jgi:hypothetical protein
MKGTAVILPALLSLLVINVQGQQPGWYVAMPDENVPYFNKTKLIVCTTPWTPAVFCDPDQDPLDWTGFEIELFRTVTIRMGLAPEMLGKLKNKIRKGRRVSSS